jgi:hypothetical protein
VRRTVVVVVCVMVMSVAAPAALAKPSKVGCPASPIWTQMTVVEAGDLIWNGLIDQSPWENQDDFTETAVAPYDRNGDGSICVGVIWENLNPNSPWFPFLTYLPRDNNSNGANSAG